MPTHLMKRPEFHTWLVLIIVLFSAALFLSSLLLFIVKWRISRAPEHEDTPSILSRYSFIKDDYPAYYPLDSPKVILTPEDTVHYQISSPKADSEWAALFPPGGGFMHLGPGGTPFVLTLYHQLHCLDRIRHAISEGQSTQHVHHCFNYLRQLVLCEADSTLEPAVLSAGPHAAYFTGPRTCVDWSHVYEIAAANHQSTSGKFRRERSEFL